MKQRGAMERQGSHWHMLVRIIWCVVAVLALGLVVTSMLVANASLYGLVHGSYAEPVLAFGGSRFWTSAMASWSKGYALYNSILCFVFALSYLAIAGVLIWRKPDDRMALFAAFFFVLLAVMFCEDLLALPRSWQVSIAHLIYLGVLCLFLFFCLFPLGRLTPWWSGLMAIVAICYWGAYVLFLGAPPNPFEHRPLLRLIVEYSLVAGLAFLQLYRYRYVSDAVMRRQTKWVVFGACGTAILYIAQQQFAWLVVSLPSVHLLALVISDTMFFVALLLIPISIGIAILRSHLWNIDIIIHRTLVYGILSACVVGLYILVVGGLGTVLQQQGNILISLLATGLIAFLFQPLRERLQRAVNYLVYGERNDPYLVLSRLSQRLETTFAPESALSTIVETVAQVFKFSYVVITLKQEEQFVEGAVYGQAAQEDELLHIPLTYQGEFQGELILAGGAPRDAFPLADWRLLEDLARHAGVAVHAVRLSVAIQRSREQLVMAREEERRRLRRDLHDGLGPQLASLHLLLTSVRKMLHKNPEAAEQMLTEAMTYMREAISDIRRLVYGLRPPALDDLGLLAALQEDMRRYHASGVAFTLLAPDRLPPLPAAVEVACYRIAQVALTNVISHAHAHQCTVHLSIDNGLHLEVIDDGHGLPATWKNGIGLNSLRERTQELGGTYSIDSVPQGGTRVSVCLPLRQGAYSPDL